MDIKDKYLERAENEIILAKTNFEISINEELKNRLGIERGRTFFNNVISSCYYAIFYSAKAILLHFGIKTDAPEEHKKTYDEFKKLVEARRVDKKLFEIYEEESVKAETLLNIFFTEKRKRGRFTYNVNANANKPFAEDSIKNAIFFTKTIKQLIRKR
ncbi:MAG: hypothetical protein QW286_00520 [Candidatus Aenigmatarchaeota archaeon]